MQAERTGVAVRGHRRLVVDEHRWVGDGDGAYQLDQVVLGITGDPALLSGRPDRQA